jgi:hypothetical protein
MRAALAILREVLGGESFEHDREGHRGEKLLEVASEWRRRARPKSVALSGTFGFGLLLGLFVNSGAYLLTVKRDTEKNCNQISETQELKR